MVLPFTKETSSKRGGVFTQAAVSEINARENEGVCGGGVWGGSAVGRKVVFKFWRPIDYDCALFGAECSYSSPAGATQSHCLFRSYGCQSTQRAADGEARVGRV